jgi:hypothetical protein
MELWLENMYIFYSKEKLVLPQNVMLDMNKKYNWFKRTKT